MKKLTYILCAAFILAFAASCDEIDNPYKVKSGPVVDTTKSAQKILIEEFTGSQCPNCPSAGQLAMQIQEAYKGNVIVVSVHAGGLAEPKPSEGFPYDFTTDVGDELDSYFGLQYTPTALINRTNSSATSKIFGKGAWETKVADLNGKTAPVRIELKAEFAEASNTLTANVEVYFPQAGAANQSLIVYVLEDSIIQPQLVKDAEPDYVPNYCHNHVLRCSMNSVWGEKLSATDTPTGTTIKKTYTVTKGQSGFPNSADWVAKNLKVVAFVIDKDATNEVLQVEEAAVVLK